MELHLEISQKHTTKEVKKWRDWYYIKLVGSNGVDVVLHVQDDITAQVVRKVLRDALEH